MSHDISVVLANNGIVVFALVAVAVSFLNSIAELFEQTAVMKLNNFDCWFFITVEDVEVEVVATGKPVYTVGHVKQNLPEYLTDGNICKF